MLRTLLYMNFDSHYTPSSREQRALEEQVSRFYEQSPDSGVDVALDRSRHIRYLQDGLRVLPRGFSSLEAARPWLLYWLTHSLALLGADLPDDISVVGEQMNDEAETAQQPHTKGLLGAATACRRSPATHERILCRCCGLPLDVSESWRRVWRQSRAAGALGADLCCGRGGGHPGRRRAVCR